MGTALARLAAETLFPSDIRLRKWANRHKRNGRTPFGNPRGPHEREFKVDANVGAPQVAYRETITQTAEIDYTHKKQTGGSGQFARIKLYLNHCLPAQGLNLKIKWLVAPFLRNTSLVLKKG